MVFIIGASSLSHALDTLPKNQKKRYADQYFAVPGASANPSTLNKRKTLQHFLDPKRGLFRQKTDIVIWHGLINNSIAKHRVNKYKKLESADLVKVLLSYKEQIAAIVYCQREGTPNI